MKGVDAETIDAIKEIVNIGVGRAAGHLNQMTNSHIRLQVPSVELVHLNEITAPDNKLFSEDMLSAVVLNFKGNFSGISAVLIPPKSAISLVMLLTGEVEDSPELDAIRIEALKEVGNIMINAVMGSIANALSEHLVYTIPIYIEGSIAEIMNLKKQGPEGEWVLLVRTNFLIESRNIEGHILFVLEIGSLDRLIESIHKASDG